MSLKRLGTLDISPKDHFALNDALPLHFACISELFLGAAEGILCGAPQGLGPQNVVVGDRDLIGNGLVGAGSLQPRDFSRQSACSYRPRRRPKSRSSHWTFSSASSKFVPTLNPKGIDPTPGMKLNPWELFGKPIALPFAPMLYMPVS